MKAAWPAANTCNDSGSAMVTTVGGEIPWRISPFSQRVAATASLLSRVGLPSTIQRPPKPRSISRKTVLSPSYWRPCQTYPQRTEPLDCSSRLIWVSSVGVRGGAGIRSVRQ